MTDLLLIGRWHAVTRDQESALRAAIERIQPDRLLFVITGADQGGTKRHPLSIQPRLELVHHLAGSFGLPCEYAAVCDLPDSTHWVGHVRKAMIEATAGRATLDPSQTRVLTANPEVQDQFRAEGYDIVEAAFEGTLPVDLLAALAAGRDWRALASPSTVTVYEAHGLEAEIRSLFAEVLLTEDGELSTGRDFRIYAAGMDASMSVKLLDVAPHIVPGLIVDKGCGTGKLLVHLSELFPTSEIVGVDLSRELLRVAESQHYPGQNVSVIKGNIIHRQFRPGSVTTVLYSSVLHEVYSYNRYDRGMVRRALANTREELAPGGRLIIRDGIRPTNPGQRVWMRCDSETQERFRRFARDFKGKSPTPGVRFTEHSHEGQTWFTLSLHDAAEFLSKKDYLANWDIEVNEEFGVFTLDEWREELESLDYQVREARGYVNPWIEENRYRGKVWLHADSNGLPGKEIPFPDTTAVIVGEAQ